MSKIGLRKGDGVLFAKLFSGDKLFNVDRKFSKLRKTIGKHLNKKSLDKDFRSFLKLADERLGILSSMDDISGDILPSLIAVAETLTAEVAGYNKMGFQEKVDVFSKSSPEKVGGYIKMRLSYITRLEKIVSNLDDAIFILDKAMHDKTEVSEDVMKWVMHVIKEQANAFVDAEKQSTGIVTGTLIEIGLKELEEKYSKINEEPTEERTSEAPIKPIGAVDMHDTYVTSEVLTISTKVTSACILCGLPAEKHRCCFCGHVDIDNLTATEEEKRELRTLNLLAEKTIVLSSDVNNFIVDDFTLVKYVGMSDIVVVPSGIRIIAGNCFKDTNITKVKIPVEVEYIGNAEMDNDGAFEFCRELTEVYFDEGSRLKAIGQYSFSGCVNLRAIKGLPQSHFSIGLHAFKGCPIDSDLASHVRRFASAVPNWNN